MHFKDRSGKKMRVVDCFPCLSSEGVVGLKQKSPFTMISCARLRLETQLCSSIRLDNEAVGGLPDITGKTHTATNN